MLDYTSLANFKLYDNNPSGTSDDTFLSGLITAVSRSMDQYCNMSFARATYTNQVLAANPDLDGTLLAYTSTPTIATVTAAAFKVGNSQTWNAIDTGTLETVNYTHGCEVRAIGDYAGYRGARRVQIQLSYTGGWATLADVPADFEMLCRRIVQWEYKKMDAAQEKTANPALGIVIIPGNWPPDVKQKLTPYKRPF